MHTGGLFDDRYELIRRAGAGGMGTVWRAKERSTGRTVALKVLRDAEGEGAARFRKEAHILATFEHPHVVRYVGHAISTEGEPYLVMEWLDGENLLERLERGMLGISESIAITLCVADALAKAHARGITHRDIKPSNIFLEGGEPSRVKLLDFGIARLQGAGVSQTATKTGSILGTPGYMAPEQARGEREAGAPADVFALGCVLFECLSGKPAFQGAHPMALLAKLLFEEPPRLSDLRSEIPPALASLCARMLAKKPEERPADGAAVLEALAAFEEGATKDKPTAGEAPQRTITGTERRLVSIVAVSPPAGHDPRLPAPRELVTAVQRTALPLGAHVEELSNGVVIAVLAGEGSVMDQAANAARCAVWVKLVAAQSAVALTTGRAESTNRLPMGEALERAAALLDEALAKGSESPPLCIDEMTRALVEPRFEVVSEEGRLVLRGERRGGQEIRTLLGKPSPFVGRERELRNLLELCEESFEEARAQAVLVTAPAGTGKSRLRQELVRAIRERHPNVALTMARPDAIGAGSAYALLSGSLRDALGISAGEPIEAQRAKIERLASTFHAGEDSRWIAEFLGELAGARFPDEQSPRLRAARQNPQLMADRIEAAYVRTTAAISATRSILLVLEDLHWGDAPSLKIIDAILRDLSDRPFMVLAFARPEVHDLFPRLFSGRNVQEVRLGPLARRAATELVASALGASATPESAAALVERAEGNAFYLEELIRAVAEGRGRSLPDTVLGMVEARLAALGPEARRLLRAASIFGEVFWASGVRELCGEGVPVDELLADLQARELVAKRPHARFVGQEEYAFRHAILREGAYAMLTEDDLRLGHRLAGEWLEKAGELDALVLGEHYQRGGDLPWAAAYFLRAGSQSFDRDDLPGALACAERGIACGDVGEVLGNLHTLAATAYCWQSELSSAHRSALSALPLVAPGTRWECMLLFHGAWAALVIGEEEDFQSFAARFVAFEPEFGADRDYLLWAPLAASLFTTYGRRDLCGALLDRAEKLADTLPTLDLGLVGALAIGRSDQVRAFERAPSRQLALTKQAALAFEAIGDTRNQITALSRLGQALGEIGEPKAGEEALRRAGELSLRIRGPFVSMQSALHLAALLSKTNEPAKWTEADRIARSVLEAQGVSHGYRGWAHGIRAQIQLHRGEPSEAALSAREAAPLCERVPLRKCWIQALLVRALLASGKTSEARAVAQALIPELGSLGGGGYIEIEAFVAIAEACFATGDLDLAKQNLAQVMRVIDIRAQEIADNVQRAHYLEAVPEVRHARSLAARFL